jgi:hypothetical protein
MLHIDVTVTLRENTTQTAEYSLVPDLFVRLPALLLSLPRPMFTITMSDKELTF